MSSLSSILLDIDHKIALDTLPMAEGASFDSHAEEHNPTCLKDTSGAARQYRPLD
jgi:hypothetical protein